MATLQVKGLDDALYRALAARAAEDNRSISQEVVTIIEDFLDRCTRSHRQATDELLALAGSWEDSRSAKDIAAAIRRSRRSGRRFRGDGNVLD